MKTTDAALSHTPARRGFNLVEAAIVLGVIGLVIGGIWVAASEVTKNRTVSKLSEATLQYITNSRNIMSGQQPTPSAVSNWNNLIQSAKLIPDDVLTNGINGVLLGGGLWRSSMITEIYLNSAQIFFKTSSSHRAMCRQALVRIINQSYRDLIFLSNTSVPVNITGRLFSSPVSLSTAEINTACSAPELLPGYGLFLVQLWYPLNGA